PEADASADHQAGPQGRGRAERSSSGRASRRPVAGQTVVVAVVLVVATVLAFLGARRAVDDREDQELSQRTADVSSLISTALGEIRASLVVLGGLADRDDQPEEWAAAAQPLVSGQVKVVAELTP